MPNNALLAILQQRVFEKDGSTSSAALKRFEQNRIALSAVANAIAGKTSAEESLDAILPVMARFGIQANRDQAYTWFESLDLCGQRPSLRELPAARINLQLQAAAAKKAILLG